MRFGKDEMLNIKLTYFNSIYTSSNLSKNRAVIKAQLNSNWDKLS